MITYIKKIFILLFISLIISIATYETPAQDIPNGDFEVWTISGQPGYWITNNINWPVDCRQVFPGAPAYNGNMCALGLVDTCAELSKLIPPILYSDLIPLDNYRPEALHGFYKFFPLGNDRFSASVLLYKNNSVIGESILISDSEVTEFTEFVLNINYSATDTPDVALIIFTIDSSLTGSKLHQGSKWYIDYLFFGPISDVDDQDTNIPNSYSLSQNYPNPFNPSTTIKYQIPQLSFVSLKVFNLIGKEIVTLVNEEKPAGIYEVTWYAENLPSGIYFYQLKAGDFIESKKMILLK